MDNKIGGTPWKPALAACALLALAMAPPASAHDPLQCDPLDPGCVPGELEWFAAATQTCYSVGGVGTALACVMANGSGSATCGAPNFFNVRSCTVQWSWTGTGHSYAGGTVYATAFGRSGSCPAAIGGEPCTTNPVTYPKSYQVYCSQTVIVEENVVKAELTGLFPVTDFHSLSASVPGC